MSWYEGIERDSPAYAFAVSTAEVIYSIAGPGTGKTYALKRRIAKLLHDGVDPRRILAVTFTRTAAADLKKEISSLNVDGASEVVARNLHSICYQILLRREILRITGRNPRIMLDHEIKTMLRDLTDSRYGDIRRKEKRVKAYEAAWARLQQDDPGHATNEIDESFEGDLLSWLKSHNAMLIGEIIPITLMYLKDNPEAIERRKYDYVLVDEFQDLNKAEQKLIYLLKSNGKLTIIGDDNQSIYTFKYAHPEGIRQIPVVFPDCNTINFHECRRCPTLVVDMAVKLIHHNSDCSSVDLFPRSRNDRGIVNLIQWPSLQDEITGVAEIVIQHLHNDQIITGDVLILSPRRLIGYQIRNILKENDINVKGAHQIIF